GEPRISMFQTIREFGLEHLQKSPADAKARRAHAKYFASFAEDAEANRRGPEYAIWAKRVATERDNFRTALNWSFENAPDLTIRITAAVGEFWFRQGHWAELRTACEKVTTAKWIDLLPLQARCARFAGQCARVTGDPERANTIGPALCCSELWKFTTRLEKNIMRPGIALNSVRSLRVTDNTLRRESNLRSLKRPFNK